MTTQPSARPRPLDPLEPRLLLTGTLPVADYWDLSAGKNWSLSGTFHETGIGAPVAATATVQTGTGATYGGQATGRYTLNLSATIGGQAASASYYRDLAFVGGRLNAYYYHEQTIVGGAFDGALEEIYAPLSVFDANAKQGKDRAFAGTFTENELNGGGQTIETNTVNLTGGTATFVGFETVTSSLGTFTAAHLSADWSWSYSGAVGSGTQSEDYWFVQGLGLVRYELHSSEQYGGGTETTDIVLDSFDGSSTFADYQNRVAAAPAVDFNGDDNADLVWRNQATGKNVVWLMDGDTRIGTVNLPSLGTQWELAGVADFNEDGTLDLLWRNTNNGRNTIWFLNAQNKVSGSARPGPAGTQWRIAGVADFDGDDHADILFERDNRSARTAWTLDGSGVKDGSMSIEGLGTNFAVSAIADLDRNGEPDLVFRRVGTTVTQAALMIDGKIQGTYRPPTKGAAWHLAAIGDFNDDGQLDFVWRRGDQGYNQLILGDGAGTDVRRLARSGSDWRLPGTNTWYV